MLFDKIVHNLQQLCSEAGPVQHLGAGDDLDDVLPCHRLLAWPCGCLRFTYAGGTSGPVTGEETCKQQRH